MRSAAHLFHEIGALASMQRSGNAFLGTGHQSIAEHSFRVVAIAFVLARLIKEPINELKLMQMCLFHDFPESRIGDHNYVQKRYLKVDHELVYKDIERSAMYGKEIIALIKECEAKETLEAQLAHDADQLELLCFLKKELDTGNARAKEWMFYVEKRVKTDPGKKLATEICETPFDEWWLRDHHEPSSHNPKV